MKIAFLRKDDQDLFDWIPVETAAAGFDFVDCQPKTPQEIADVAADADIVWDMGGVMFFTAEIMPQLERCGAIIRGGSGTDNIPVAEATAMGIIVANTPAGPAPGVAEHTIGLILDMTRQISRSDREIRAGTWNADIPMPTLVRGSTVGLVGFGHVPRGVATHLQSFGVELLAHDPGVESAVMDEFDVRSVSLDELLVQSDIVSLHTPLLETTHHLIGAAELGRMKSTSILINTARGPVVDSVALAKALQDGTIAGAAVDVLEEEPAAADDPLVGLTNIVITPHNAGLHPTVLENFCRLALQTAIDLSQYKWPVSYVNPEVVPRWDMAER
ncbi:MAG: C-terminal binding protein [Lentisphaeria bacterium]|nr:C-terminal binding protein [Lentisphaeria bacterium]MDP7741056.1 C-terminal binding protein [Lentisphaeria bacterium]